MKRPVYTWIIPIYNEAPSLIQLFGEITSVMENTPYEIIAVNDGSTDGSQKILSSYQKTLRELRTITLISHQGKWAAIRAGIEHTRSDIVITIDADLQDDPREIPALLHVFHQGYDVVSGWRKHRQDDWYKIAISHLGNALISHLVHKKFHDLNAPMKVYRRESLMALPHEGSLLRFSLLFAHALAIKTIELPVMHRRRRYGTSKFGLIKYIRIIYDLLLIQLLFSGSGRVRKPT